jgi:hypothetical protein
LNPRIGNRGLLATGAAGILAVVVCCAAPGLLAGFAALSLAGVAAWFGWTLIAVIVVLAALAGYWVYRRRLAVCRPPQRRIAPDER